MTKIQNSDIKCPYCAVQLKRVQTDKGFYYVCPVCQNRDTESASRHERANEQGGKRRTSDQINDIRTKIHHYI